MSTRTLALTSAVALLVVAGCSSSSKRSATLNTAAATTTTTSIVAAPAGLPAFYAVPEPIPTTPGMLIKSQRVRASGINGTIYRVMYVSTTVHNQPTPVTGVIIVPNKTAPPGGYPIVSWGHGTNGMADRCAPSLDPGSAAPLANMLLDQGWEVAASDYQGEGTPGLLPYIAGDSAARNTIDIVRAAQHLPPAHAGTNYVVWGHSEGGQTAMYALHIGRSYAPDLKLEGVVAGAPPSQFRYIYDFLKTSPFKHYLLMAAGGLHAAYGDQAAPLDQVLTPYGVSLLTVLDKGCSDYVAQQVAPVDFTKATKTDPFTVPAWQKILLANDPQGFTAASPVPLLIIQGGSDEQIPVVSTQLLAQHLCGLGQDLERWIYPGQSHAGVIGPSATDMTHWIDDRFTNGTNPDPYKPKGLPNIQTTTCPNR
jgi:alpha-beta hydrolase superfamily lysophospholipase